MTPIDKLKRRAIGAVHDHRQVYLDPQAVLDLVEERERLQARVRELEHALRSALNANGFGGPASDASHDAAHAVLEGRDNG